MDGLGGLRAWRWIFIVEGLVSTVVGCLALLFVPDTPSTTRWLTPVEARYLAARQQALPGRAHKEDWATRKVDLAMCTRTTWTTVWAAIKSPHVLATGLMYTVLAAPIVAIKFNLPRIVKAMGTAQGESAVAQLLTIPPYIAGVSFMVFTSWLWDRLRWRRATLIVLGGIITIVAHVILYVYAPTQENHVAATYFALCLAAVGLFSMPPAMESWLSMNSAPAARRSVVIAVCLMMANCGAIIGTFIYRENEAPLYPTGYGSAFSLAGFGTVLAVGLEWWYWRINCARSALDKDEVLQAYTQEELEELGDRSPLFRFSY